ncbi:hypothetical protein [Rhizobium sp. Rhizsp42]|uniref:hypothetical protein n=1 Tax=Rhizobium sp. Rhizsp42 TaxID=3243034 RepID=UPI0039AF7506
MSESEPTDASSTARWTSMPLWAETAPIGPTAVVVGNGYLSLENAAGEGNTAKAIAMMREWQW